MVPQKKEEQKPSTNAMKRQQRRLEVLSKREKIFEAALARQYARIDKYKKILESLRVRRAKAEGTSLVSTSGDVQVVTATGKVG